MMDDQVSWDAVYASNFESAALWDVSWMSKARDLWECARKLEPEVLRVLESFPAASRNAAAKVAPDHYQGAYFMLLSFAVEDILKAAAISRNGLRYKREFKTNKKFPSELQDHDLVRLALLVDLGFENGEEDLLRRLTRSAVWHGRYPAPLKYPEMSGLTKFLDGTERRISWYSGSDIDRLNSLIRRLPARLGLNDQSWESAAQPGVAALVRSGSKKNRD
jgi:hypothetical protein